MHHNFYLKQCRGNQSRIRKKVVFSCGTFCTCNSGTDEMAETAAHNYPEHIVQAHQNNGGQLQKTPCSSTATGFRFLRGGGKKRLKKDNLMNEKG